MSSRIKSLDCLRGIAALAVVIFHYTNASNPYANEVYEFNYGHYGVHLFFIISGFVISMTLQSKSTIKDFAIARFQRLFPIYWVCMTITYVIVAFYGLPKMKTSLSEFFVNLTMLQRFFNTKYVDGAYWTLQYELFFYVIIGLLFYFGSKNFKVILAFFGFLTLTSLIINLLGVNDLANSWPRLNSAIYFRIYGIFVLEFVHLFLIGISIYSIYQLKFKSAWFYFALGAVTSLSFKTIDFVALIFILALVIIALRADLAIFKMKFLIWLGSISYVLYMLHTNIGRIVVYKLWDVGFTPYLAISLGVLFIVTFASVVHKFIENPLYKKMRGKELTGC